MRKSSTHSRLFLCFPSIRYSPSSAARSGRLGVALASLLALPGAFLLGKALNGRVGALALLLLVAIDPLYLAQSQTLQAEAPCVAFMLLAAGCAYLWWEHPDGLSAIVLAALTGITIALSIWSKFF